MRRGRTNKGRNGTNSAKATTPASAATTRPPGASAETAMAAAARAPMADTNSLSAGASLLAARGPMPDAATRATPPSAVRPRPGAAQSAQFTQLFANVIAVLMRDVTYRELRLKDLERTVIPPIVAGQCVVAHTRATKDGPLIPIALTMWARVSDAIDKRLASNLDKPFVLKPNEWASGDNVWMVVLAGDRKALTEFLEQVLAKDLKGKTVKMRTTAKDGTRGVKMLAAGNAAA